MKDWNFYIELTLTLLCFASVTMLYVFLIQPYESEAHDSINLNHPVQYDEVIDRNVIYFDI